MLVVCLAAAAITAVFGGAGVLLMRRMNSGHLAASTEHPDSSQVQLAQFQEALSDSTTAKAIDDPAAKTLELPLDRWEASGIELQPAHRGRFSTTVRLTGKVSLNQDRVAHIYPMVEGTVESVSVGLGEKISHYILRAPFDGTV